MRNIAELLTVYRPLSGEDLADRFKEAEPSGKRRALGRLESRSIEAHCSVGFLEERVTLCSDLRRRVLVSFRLCRADPRLEVRLDRVREVVAILYAELVFVPLPFRSLALFGRFLLGNVVVELDYRLVAYDLELIRRNGHYC